MSATTVPGTGPWWRRWRPAFEKATGIKIDFTLLPVDPWRARLRAELGAGSGGIDIVQWSVGMAGWIAPAHATTMKLRREDHGEGSGLDWDDFLAGSKKAATYDGKLVGIPYRITTGIMHYQKASAAEGRLHQPPGTWPKFVKAAIALNTPPERYGFGIYRPSGRRDLQRLRAVALFRRRRAGGSSRPAKSSSTVRRRVFALEF